MRGESETLRVYSQPYSVLGLIRTLHFKHHLFYTMIFNFFQFSVVVILQMLTALDSFPYFTIGVSS